MRVHHLNCATMHPILPKLMHGSVAPEHRRFVCHCLLIETPDSGLVLVDSGFGTADIEQGRLPGGFVRIVRPTLDLAEIALHQVRALGHDPTDVRHIVLSHLDLDHAGGLSDFPHARVHVTRAEHDAAMKPNLRERPRYHRAQWAHGPEWALHEPDGEPWFGFECVRELPGLPPEVLLVPLHGHTRGHAAVAVDTGDGWLMHCGDAYFHHGCLKTPRKQPFGVSVFETAVQMNGRVRKRNQARLRELAAGHGDQIKLFSAHDSVEFGELTP